MNNKPILVVPKGRLYIGVKSLSNKKDVVISDNRSFLYYITKDGYISSSLQEQIAKDRIIKFGYSNGIKANAWNIPSAIQLPMKLPN